MQPLLNKIEQHYGIRFKHIDLLESAFTHTSYANEHRLLKISHNERLEFLGDAVLQLIISQYLYDKYPQKPEGDLSKMRSMIVREESLASFSRQCDFHQHIRLGKGEEKSGGRDRDTILGDLFEAFLGALYLDQGLATVQAFILKVMIPKIESGSFEQVKDYKTSLQEVLQVDGDVLIQYRVIDESGPAHDKFFQVEVSVDDRVLSHGSGKSKKLAEQAAAKSALEDLKRG